MPRDYSASAGEERDDMGDGWLFAAALLKKTTVMPREGRSENRYGGEINRSSEPAKCAYGRISMTWWNIYRPRDGV